MNKVEDLRVELTDTPPTHDSKEINWYKEREHVGHGYIGKKDNRIHIERCPICEVENYAMQIAVGSCYNCGFDPNEDIEDGA